MGEEDPIIALQVILESEKDFQIGKGGNQDFNICWVFHCAQKDI